MDKLKRRETMSPIEAISFDYDGTLANTISAMKEATKMIIKNISSVTGISYNELHKQFTLISEHFSRKGNYNRHLWIKETLKHFNINMKDHEIVKLVREYWGFVAKNTRLYDEAMEVLVQLKRKGYMVAILTNTDGSYGIKRRRILKVFPKNFFDAIIVAGDDTEEPKPHVEAFYMLAKTLNVEPEKIMHVGDDYLTDIVGGLKAGVLPVLISRESKFPKVAKNIIAIRSLRELLMYL